MLIPRWVVFLVAGWTLLFGAYRMRIAILKWREPKRPPPQFRRKGMYAMSPRRHFLFGLAYIIIGAYLVAMGFGYGLGFGPSARRTLPGKRSGQTVKVKSK